MTNCIDLIKEARPEAPKGSFYSCPHGRVYRLKAKGWKPVRNPWLIRRVERECREAMLERAFDELARVCEAAAARADAEADREAREDANRLHNANERAKARAVVDAPDPSMPREEHKRRVLRVFHAARRGGKTYNEAVDYSVERYAENNHLNKHTVHNMLLEAYNDTQEGTPRVSLVKDDGTDKTPDEIRAEAGAINAAAANRRAETAQAFEGGKLTDETPVNAIKVELSPAVAVAADGTRRPAPVITVDGSPDLAAVRKAAANVVAREQGQWLR
ncbi:hypothetical protein HYQ19_gp076 [Arthrobacter phage DrYang]|uniref:Uncharacterized protein n=1 Tax=Arthrobacter phage DrYang TaxID=2686080 RepID=A0A6B9J7N9_9CAUD|nr:hypothetical protein HYQ19_gp076 [Arthrobacter phage DrYang]QGZ17175.1 hypothetical protein SEA_DRYANG_76 [Arthrobacter phage DrYang]